MVMRSQTTDGRSASKCQGKWPDQLFTHRFKLPTLLQRSAPPACLARTPEKRKKFALVRRFIWGIPDHVGPLPSQIVAASLRSPRRCRQPVAACPMMQTNDWN
jgi:hypothetical protein